MATNTFRNIFLRSYVRGYPQIEQNGVPTLLNRLSNTLLDTQTGSQLRCVGCARSMSVWAHGGRNTHTAVVGQHHRGAPKRLQHTDALELNWYPEKLPMLKRLKWNSGLWDLKVPNRELIQSGNHLYICCTDFIDFPHFITETGLPDVFNSWFVLLQLHMWIVYVKIAQMGPEGFLLKDYMYIQMWTDVEKRLKSLEDMNVIKLSKTKKTYYSIFLQSILYYDEGLQSSDKVLASNLWTTLYENNPDVQPEKLEMLVQYVRKNVHHQDRLDPYSIMKTGYISFLPLHGDRLDKAKAEADLQKLMAFKYDVDQNAPK